jgi:hypothetical protein
MHNSTICVLFLSLIFHMFRHCRHIQGAYPKIPLNYSDNDIMVLAPKIYYKTVSDEVQHLAVFILFHTALLYVFRVLLAPIIRSSKNCMRNLRYES